MTRRRNSEPSNPTFEDVEDTIEVEGDYTNELNLDDLRASIGGWKENHSEGALWVHMERLLGKAETRNKFPLIRGYFKGHDLAPNGWVYANVLRDSIDQYLNNSPRHEKLIKVGEFL